MSERLSDSSSRGSQSDAVQVPSAAELATAPKVAEAAVKRALELCDEYRQNLGSESLLAAAQDFRYADYRKRLRKAAAGLAHAKSRGWDADDVASGAVQVTLLAVLHLWGTIASTVWPSLAPACVHRFARRVADVAAAEKAILLIRSSSTGAVNQLVAAVSASLNSLIDVLILVTKISNSLTVVMSANDQAVMTDVKEYASLLASLLTLSRLRLLATQSVARLEPTLQGRLADALPRLEDSLVLKGKEISTWIAVNKTSDCALYRSYAVIPSRKDTPAGALPISTKDLRVLATPKTRERRGNDTPAGCCVIS